MYSMGMGLRIMASTGWKLKQVNNFFSCTQCWTSHQPHCTELADSFLTKDMKLPAHLRDNDHFVSLLEWASVTLLTQTDLPMKEDISCEHFQAHCFDGHKMFIRWIWRIWSAKIVLLFLHFSKVNLQPVKRPLPNAGQLF